MNKELLFKRLTVLTIVIFLLNLVLFGQLPDTAQASPLTESGLLLSRMGVSKATSSTDPILVVFKPASTATEKFVKISFAAGFSIAATVLASTASMPLTFDQTVLNTTALAGSPASTVSVTDVSFSTTDLTPGTLYGFIITTGVTNPSSVGSQISTITTQSSGPTNVDASRVVTNTVTGNTDQVTVTASVPPSFTFTLNANTIAFGDLASNSTVSKNNVTATVTTNATNGWVVWQRGTNGGGGTAAMTSATTSDSIASQGSVGGACSTYVSGTAFYQLRTSGSGSGPGTITIPGPYNCTADSTHGGTIAKTFQEVATSNGPATSDTVTFVANAAMSATNKAADDYTDTWTVVGAGAF